MITLNSLADGLSNPEILQEIINLDNDYFPFPWSTQGWDNLKWERFYLNYAKDLSTDEIVGFSLFEVDEQMATSHLLKICVHSDYRNLKLATKLLHEAFSVLRKKGTREVYLEVQELNEPAIMLYVNLGFTSYHVAKSYYSNGDDAKRMRLTL